jgi:hypothetical protein
MKFQLIRFTSCVAVIGGLFAVADVRAAQWLIYGLAIDNDTRSDYTEGGATTNLRPISPFSGLVAGIDFSADGTLFGLSAIPNNSLYKISPTTGVSTLVGPTGLSQIREGDLGFDPSTGSLYGLYNLGSDGYEFFTLNPTTGAATIIGAIGSDDLADFSGLAFDNSGQMWVVDTLYGRGPTLLKVDKTNGNIISMQSTGLPAGTDAEAAIIGADFDPTTNDLCFVWEGNFYRENIASGHATLIGPSGGSEETGLAFVRVPEPESLLLFVIGMSGIAALYRRNHLRLLN